MIPTVVEPAHGPLRLPAYFPDATRGVVRTVDSRDLEAVGVPGLVVNAFHLSTRPGAGLIKQAGGIHALMDWRRPVASDSGGFQIMIGWLTDKTPAWLSEPGCRTQINADFRRLCLFLSAFTCEICVPQRLVSQSVMIGLWTNRTRPSRRLTNRLKSVSPLHTSTDFNLKLLPSLREGDGCPKSK